MTHLQKELSTSLIHRLILTCGMSPVYFSILDGLSFLFDPKVGILAGLDYLQNATLLLTSARSFSFTANIDSQYCVLFCLSCSLNRGLLDDWEKKKCAMICVIPSTTAHFKRGLNLFLLRLFSHTYSSQHKDFISKQDTFQGRLHVLTGRTWFYLFCFLSIGEC